MAPKVSVIIPVYNVEEYLQQCLDSIFSQTLEEIEIICVNDGSKDNSLSILKQNAEKDSRVKIIDKPNGGLSSARNAGIESAAGKYIYFIDSDDYLETTALSELYELAEKEQLQVIDFDATSFFENEDTKEKHKEYINAYERKINTTPVLNGQDYFALCMSQDDFKPSACLHFINREYLNSLKLQFLYGILYEDNLFTMQLLLQANKVMYIRKIFYYRRVHEGSIVTSKYTGKNAYSYFISVCKMLDFIPTIQLTEDCKAALTKRLNELKQLALTVYSQLEDKNLDSYFVNDPKNKFLFDSIIKEPYEETESLRNSSNFKVGKIVLFLPKAILKLFRK